MTYEGVALGRRACFLILAAAILIGCGGGPGSDGSGLLIWGGPGLGNGEFRRPRAIGVLDDEVYVIDTTGRVQVFTLDGKYLRKWSTPDSKNGTPTAIALSPSGEVVIPDTHYQRILEYTKTGEPIRSWGSYGTGENEFIYPTGLVFGKDGAYYISEYGMDADRVHVFDPERRFRAQWGKTGEGEEEFNRAMAIGMDEQGYIYVADTTNHRIQRFDSSGKFLGIISRPGTGPGELNFPYDLAVAPDGSILACEYGNHRISRFSSDGKFMGSFGLPGRDPGEFNGPRGVAVSKGGLVFVADTDNNRIQRLRLEDLH